MRELTEDLSAAVVRGVQVGGAAAPAYMIARLEEVGAVDTGQLKGAISRCVENTPEGVQFNIRSRYAAPIEYGARPHFPPVEALRPWVRRKLGEVDADGEGDRGVAFAVAATIAQYGIEPRHYVADSIPEIMGEVERSIDDELRRL